MAPNGIMHPPICEGNYPPICEGIMHPPKRRALCRSAPTYTCPHDLPSYSQKTDIWSVGVARSKCPFSARVHAGHYAVRRQLTHVYFNFMISQLLPENGHLERRRRPLRNVHAWHYALRRFFERVARRDLFHPQSRLQGAPRFARGVQPHRVALSPKRSKAEANGGTALRGCESTYGEKFVSRCCGRSAIMSGAGGCRT